uniref:Endonuclease domain-containing 1 protein-like n=1 Tax=Cyprinus carpio TaxID=7962 RepID=A0A8C1Z422_CYPCA
MNHLVFLLLLSSVCFFTMSEVVDNNFSKCKEFFLNNAPPDFTAPAGVSVVPICQCLWDDKGQPIYLYATLYSTTWKIPVYSAYVYKPSKSIGRCDTWYIEPQLDVHSTTEQCMRSKGHENNIGTNQALNSDYKNSGYDKGHLYPVLHTNNHLSMLATSTLTNAAPQKSNFNQKAWLRHEEAVNEDLKSCDVAYVVTGVVPDTNLRINKRVTVSKYYWRATCCLKGGQYTGKGYYGPDEQDKLQELTIEELNKKLQEFYKVKSPISIFPAQISLKLNRKRERPS